MLQNAILQVGHLYHEQGRGTEEACWWECRSSVDGWQEHHCPYFLLYMPHAVLAGTQYIDSLETE